MIATAANARVLRHPAIELLGRYRAVFGVAWRTRHEVAGPARLANEAAFLPAALSLQDTPIHPAPRRFALAIIALFATAIAWTCLGEVDIVAVAPGRIVVSDRTKLVQPLERSVIKRVLVKNGEHVEAGQPLVELDPTAANADKATAGEQVKAALSDALRARALLSLLSNPERDRSVPPAAQPDLLSNMAASSSESDLAGARMQLQAEWSDITAKLAKLGSELARRQAEIATARENVLKLETTVPMARQREDDFRRLAEQGFMASHAGQDRMRERVELERDLATQRARLVEAHAVLRDSEHSRAAYLAEIRRTLHDREAQASLRHQQASQEEAKAAQREKLTILTAPVAGIVQQLAVHTAGGVATEAQTLMVIVPEAAQLMAEVMLENKDIGFANPGDTAQIKLETFPFTRYGTIGAVVTLVTADAVNDEKRGAIFPAMLSLNTGSLDVDGRMVRLTPGMNLTAEIKTGRRRVIEFLLSPLQRARGESFKER